MLRRRPLRSAAIVAQFARARPSAPLLSGESAVVDHLSDAPGGRFRRGDRWKRPASGRNPSIDLYWQNLLADAFGGSRLALYIVTYFLGGIYDEC